MLAQLPKLLFIADVPVESSYHGSALLYRLLLDYPADRLRIIETNLQRSQTDRRLAHVGYAELPVGHERLLRTRFWRLYAAWLIAHAPALAARIPQLLMGFEPDAVLTVAHGYSWLAAAEFAAARNLPLYLICHDDWPRLTARSSSSSARIDRQFGRIYRQAAGRFCVSQYMGEEYQRRYDADGILLYPSRAPNLPHYAAPPEQRQDVNRPFTVAFAGSINSPGYVDALNDVATALESLPGCLRIFGPVTAQDVKNYGLDRANVTCGGLLDAAELAARLRGEADVLLVPMSFNHADAANMKAGFPSKLADATALGLPLLIYGPPYCSAVRWAKANDGVGAVVESNHQNELLTTTLRRLAASAELRYRLGKQALAAGERDFSHNAATRTFYQALSCAPQRATNRRITDDLRHTAAPHST